MSLQPPHRFGSLGAGYFAEVTPNPVSSPKLIHLNIQLLQRLNLNAANIDWLNILAGTVKLHAANPIATLYAGQQFGVWNPQLGDGRAMLIAEYPDSSSGMIWELQTKGGGETPFSRRADGRAVLRSSIREYLCSHAMDMLNVPTTHALALIGSDTVVYRERAETAAVILRVAPGFVRFGHFEIFANRHQLDNLQKLAQFVLQHHYPEYLDTAKPFLFMFEEEMKSRAAGN